MHLYGTSQTPALILPNRFALCAATATCHVQWDGGAHSSDAGASRRCRANVGNVERDFVAPLRDLADSRANSVRSTRAVCCDPTAPSPSAMALRARATRARLTPKRAQFARQTRAPVAPVRARRFSRIAVFLRFFSDFSRFFQRITMRPPRPARAHLRQRYACAPRPFLHKIALGRWLRHQSLP